MSLEAMLAAWKALPRVPTGAAGLVLLRLAWRADEKGICWPGKHSLAEETGLSKRTVDAAITGLAKSEFIKVKPRKDVQGRDISPLYVLPVVPVPVKEKELPIHAEIVVPIGEGAEAAPRDADFALEDAEIASKNSTGKSSFSASKKAPPKRVAGVTVWNERDRNTVANLIERFGEADVRAVASTLSEQGKDPLPSIVAKELQGKYFDQGQSVLNQDSLPVTIDIDEQTGEIRDVRAFAPIAGAGMSTADWLLFSCRHD